METDDDDAREVSTGAAAKIVGVSPSTLLRYETAGRITPSSRLLARGDRRFRVRDAKKLRAELEEETDRRGAAGAG